MLALDIISLGAWLYLKDVIRLFVTVVVAVGIVVFVVVLSKLIDAVVGIVCVVVYCRYRRHFIVIKN